MKAFTDYPITELGDKPNEKAPIRQIEIVDYDQDKYCVVRVAGVVKSIKAGYLYSEQGRFGEVPNINLDGFILK